MSLSSHRFENIDKTKLENCLGCRYTICGVLEAYLGSRPPFHSCTQKFPLPTYLTNIIFSVNKYFVREKNNCLFDFTQIKEFKRTACVVCYIYVSC